MVKVWSRSTHRLLLWQHTTYVQEFLYVCLLCKVSVVVYVFHLRLGPH